MMSEGMIPEERLKAEVEKRKAAEAQRKTLTEQLSEVQSQIKALTKERDQFAAQVEGVGDLRSELETARADLASGTATSTAHISMLEAGVTKGSVRDFALFQHQQHVKAEGDKAKPWGDWWEANREGMIADLAPQPTAEPTAEAAPEAARPAQPMTNNGAQPSPAPAQTYTPGMYATMSPADWSANKDQILASLKGGSF
jgi:hypothetical protein